MEKKEKYVQATTPMLFPIEPEQFWQMLRILVREEVNRLSQPGQAPTFQTPGLIYKLLFKIPEVCELFHITKPTVYEWIKHGKLKPYKVKSRVYFRWGCSIFAVTTPNLSRHFNPEKFPFQLCHFRRK